MVQPSRGQRGGVTTRYVAALATDDEHVAGLEHHDRIVAAWFGYRSAVGPANGSRVEEKGLGQRLTRLQLKTTEKEDPAVREGHGGRTDRR